MFPRDGPLSYIGRVLLAFPDSSRPGRCKTFDAAADGFERGEGSGAVCQRALSEASAAGDPILAVVRGSTSIHKGGGASLRAMRGPAIQHKVRTALADAGMTTDQLRYIEASGLGEPYGDAVEVGAYQALFQPGRAADNPLIFGSIHTNIGHLDGASGLAAFIKVVLLVNQQAVPPVVHFRELHPLVTGRKAGATVARNMGHTWDAEVNVAGCVLTCTSMQAPLTGLAPRSFPALFPMAPSPLAGVSRAESCPAGVSAFGFGGSMAHIIVDGRPASTTERVRPPLRYIAAVRYPWKLAEEDIGAPGGNGGGRSGGDDAGGLGLSTPAQKASAELAMSYLESVCRAVVEPHIDLDAELLRGTDFAAAGLRPEAHATICADLRERLGLSVSEAMLTTFPSVSRLASALLQRTLATRAGAALGVPATVRAFMDSHVARHLVDPQRAPPAPAEPPPRLPGRMVFVLSGPRSGCAISIYYYFILFILTPSPPAPGPRSRR